MTSLRLHTWGDQEHPMLRLAHGLTEAGTAWPDAVERWSAAWRVQAVNLRGHGHSPRFDAVTTPRWSGLTDLLTSGPQP